jgi:membrane-bound serine protease (ClpP class)
MVRTLILTGVALLGALLLGAPKGIGVGPGPAAADAHSPSFLAFEAATPDTVPPEDPRFVSLMRVEGAISPVTTNHISRAIAQAQEQRDAALVVELDTPGGLLQSTHDIVRLLFESEVPVIVYVAPAGARASSAGAFITLAAHVAAMAPSTTIGAASPVAMAPGAEADTVMLKKLMEDTKSFMENIAERRGRNVEWAISAVRDAASATEREAVELGVVDLVAESREELLEAVDGRVVNGDTLRTAGAEIRFIPRNLAERFLGFLIRPEIMLILMMVAIYGIMGEVTNPGGIIPGVAGVTALILLLFASAAMPLNVAGLALLALAIALFIAEAFTPTFGLLVGAGAVTFFLGALMLFQELPEPMALSWAWLIPATVLTTAFFVWIAGAGIKAQFGEGVSGVETLVGKRAQVLDPVGPRGGRVFVAGEYWNAVSDQEIDEGETCEVVAVEGLTLKVQTPAQLKTETSTPES